MRARAVEPNRAEMSAAAKRLSPTQIIRSTAPSCWPSGFRPWLLAAAGPVRVMLLGGVPFPEEVFMWWNYVARTRDEVDAANRAWTEGTDRFGDPGSVLERIPAPTPPWQRPDPA